MGSCLLGPLSCTDNLLNMMTKFLSFLFLVLQKFYNVLLSNFIKTRLPKGSSLPIIKGKVYWNATNVKIGKNVTLYPGVYLWGNNIEIGDNVSIGYGTIIYSKKRVYIGSNTFIAGHCYIIDSNHGISAGQLIKEQDLQSSENGIVIGEDVWIASQCSVIKGARINNHVVIGANSLVNKEIPENAIAYGTPAKIAGYRE